MYCSGQELGQAHGIFPAFSYFLLLSYFPSFEKIKGGL
jgi:hypothetical protein